MLLHGNRSDPSFRLHENPQVIRMMMWSIWKWVELYACGSQHTRSSRPRAGARNPQERRPCGSGGPLGLFLQGPSCLGVEDVQQAAQTLKGVKLGLLLCRNGAGTSLRREFLHAGVIALGKLEPEEGPGSARGKLALKLNYP